MKLIFAVVHDDDTNKAVRHLNEKIPGYKIIQYRRFSAEGKHDPDDWCGRRTGGGSL